MVFNTRKSRWIAAFLCSLLLLLPIIVLAGSTGQIKGRVTAKQTGDPVIGASVFVVGTQSGATTDPDGYYIIPRVDPGTYTLRISHLEFQTVEVTEVKVNADLTNEQNQEMVPKVTERADQAITVVGKADVLDMFQTGATVNISQETIKHRPVQTVENLLEQVPGVQTTSTGEVFVRGGRAGEVAYIVDGVPIDDPLGGQGSAGASLSLQAGSIADIQIIKDGFDPEYGNALSGIVNIRSQTGEKDNTRISARFMTDDLGNKDLNEYSRNYDFAVMSISGPDPILRSKILPALGLNFLEDKEFTYYLYAEVEKHDGIYQYSDYDTPNTVRDWPAFNLLGFDVHDRLSNRYSLQANFKFRPKQNLKFVLSLKKWIQEYTGFSWDYRYSSATAPVYRRDQSSIGLEVTQALSKDMNYEAIVSVTDFELTRKPGDPNHPGRGMDPDDFRLEDEWESWDDANQNGVYDGPEPIINLFPDTATYGSNFSGPGYTPSEWVDLDSNGIIDFGELLWYDNLQGSSVEFGDFRFNDNGVFDNLEGEAFIDLNGNGVWDAGEYLNDKNGNGLLDQDRLSPIGQHTPEPYIDGDSVLGEPFVDLNSNGVYDLGIDVFVIDVDTTINQDLNRNGQYDGPCSSFDCWTPGIPFYDRNGNGVYDRPNFQYDPGEPYVDVNENGVYDYGGTGTFLDKDQHLSDALWHHRSVRTYRGEVKLFRQMGRHEVKVGASITRDEVVFEEIEMPYLPYTGRPDGGDFADRGAFRDFYDYVPLRGTVYGRDKIEYGSMIASLGLRWDYFLQDTKQLAGVLESDDRGGLILGDRQKLSPRIGFSYPISDKAKVYFNYGHFFQLPDYRLMYARNTSSVNQNDVVGYPNLDFEKTIQYSFGVKYKMTENYTIDIQGYFKDEFDKINSTEVLEGNLFRQAYRNSDYGRGRGIELTLEKRGGGYVNGQVSYTYAFAFGKASQTNEDFMNRFELSREPLTEHALNIDIRHSLKSGIIFWVPQNVKPRLFGLPIPNGWTLSVESIIETGSPFTPSKEYPDIDQTSSEDIEINSLRYPMTVVFDVRFQKDFRLAGIDWNWVVWIENLFNNRNVVYVYPTTGRPDTQANQSNIVLGGNEYQNNPGNYDYGRQIRVGLEMNL